MFLFALLFLAGVSAGFEDFYCDHGEVRVINRDGLITCHSTCPSLGPGCNCTNDDHCRHMDAACVNGLCDCFSSGLVPSANDSLCLPKVGEGELCESTVQCANFNSEERQIVCGYLSRNYWESRCCTIQSECRERVEMGVDGRCDPDQPHQCTEEGYCGQYMKCECLEGFISHLSISGKFSCRCPDGYAKQEERPDVYLAHCLKIPTRIGDDCRTNRDCAGIEIESENEPVCVLHGDGNWFENNHGRLRPMFCESFDAELMTCFAEVDEYAYCIITSSAKKEGCLEYDSLGNLWTGNAGSHATIACPSLQDLDEETDFDEFQEKVRSTITDRSTKSTIDTSLSDYFVPFYDEPFQQEVKFEKWYCQLNGQFVRSGPDFTSCTSHWLEMFEKELNRTSEISTSDGLDLLRIVENKLPLYKNHTYSQAYAHELDRVFAGVNEIAQKLVVTRHDIETKLLLQTVGNIARVSLASLTPWEIVDEEKRRKMFSGFMRMIDSTPLIMAEKIRSELEYVEQVEISSINLHFAVKHQSCSDTWVSSFDGEISRSGISVRVNCRKNGYGNFTFVQSKIEGTVGFQIGQAPLRTGNLQTSRFSSFGDIVGLSLSKDATILEDVEVRVSHAGYAFGSKILKIRRQLHDGEIGSGAAVTARGAWYNTENEVWTTDGCALVQVTAYESVFKCNHLTPFTTVIRLHKYIGKSPILIVLLYMFLGGWILWFMYKLIVYKLEANEASVFLQAKAFQKFSILLTLLCYVFILFLVDKHWFRRDQSTCYAIGCVAHFLLLATIAILTVETVTTVNGILNFRGFGKVIRQLSVKPLMSYVILPAGFALLVVFITVAVDLTSKKKFRAYGGEFCWLDGTYLQSLFVPLWVLLGTNLVLVLFLFWTVTKWVEGNEVVTPKGSRFQAQDVFDMVKDGLVCNSLVLATWVLGYFSLGQNYVDSEALGWVFSFMLALQGVLYRTVMERIGFWNLVKRLVGTHCIAPILRRRMVRQRMKREQRQAQEHQQKLEMGSLINTGTGTKDEKS